MYCKCNLLFKSSSSSSLSMSHSLTNRIHHKLIHRFSSNATFKYSANMSNGDCVRLAFAYGLCGTLASYLSMNYDGKVLVFKFSVPTPERFVFCTWCWSLAGIATWRIFWTKPDALIRAAASRVRYGLFHGTQTAAISMALSFGAISFWSLRFDVQEWHIKYGEWQKSLNPQSRNLMTDIPSSSSSRSASSTNALIEEEGNEEGEVKVNIVNMDEMDSGVKIINSTLDRDENNMEGENEKKGNISSFGPRPVLPEPTLNGNQLLSNLYEPCKLFFLCNAPIWLLCGNITGIIAARLLTNSVLLNPIPTAMSAGFMCIETECQCYENMFLLDEES